MNKKVEKILKEYSPYAAVVIVVILIRTFIVTPAVVDGNSMFPTLKDNNIIILNKLDYRLNEIKRFDVVVVDYYGDKLIKRIIGMPGEHIEYKEGQLYIDKIITEENFRHGTTKDFKLETLGYLSIPGDKYLVVGDNRENSTDSRALGLISKEDILGSVSIRIFPFNKIGKVK